MRNYPVVWDHAAIVAAILAYASEHGRAPSALEWKSSGKGRPNYWSICRRFGSFHAAIRAAGLEPRAEAYRRRGQWERQDAVEAVWTWRERFGNWPRGIDWRRGSIDHPSLREVRRLFGRWAVLMAAAGCEHLPHNAWHRCPYCGVVCHGRACSAHVDLLELDPLAVAA